MSSWHDLHRKERQVNALYLKIAEQIKAKASEDSIRPLLEQLQARREEEGRIVEELLSQMKPDFEKTDKIRNQAKAMIAKYKHSGA